MKIEILTDADAMARKAAEIIAAEARAAVAERGRFVMAVSGGHTPWQMLRALANEEVPWKSVVVKYVGDTVLDLSCETQPAHPDKKGSLVPPEGPQRACLSVGRVESVAV